MTPERWAEVKAVFAAALESPIADRERYLSTACGADDELRREVDSLLAAGEGADSVPGARAAVASASNSLLTNGELGLRGALERALGSQYEILERIGHGGMGEVFRARDRVLERLVAVKVMRPDLADAAETRERFRREARIAAQLSHPGILPLHSFGEIDGIWYFVMGYVRGQSLADRLRLEGTLAAGDARRILIEVSDALEWAHRHSVIHRDIKPANILLDDESGRTILSDFGISKIKGGSEGLTRTGAVWGSVPYMSPEQSIGSSDVDERSDIYSLGAVGYAMLTGREPFADVDPEKLLGWRLSHDPTPLTSVAHSVPEDLASVVTRCLAHDREARWQSAADLRAALGRSAAPTAALPEPLRDLPSFGPYAILWAVVWTLVAFFRVPTSADRALILLVAIIVPVGLLLHVWNVGRHGLTPRELARVALWPPEWWGMWWPRALRRPTDLWARLPWQARLVRAALSAFLLALPAVVLLRQPLLGNDGPLSSGRGHDLFTIGEIVMVLGTATVVAAALWWTKRRGLSLADGARFLFGATTPSPAWSQPDVARLLCALPGDVKPPDQSSPADHRRAISDLAAMLPNGAADIGAEAARLAQRLSAAVEQCDREVASLMRDASPAEIERLESRLSALQAPPGSDSGDTRKLRDLVVHELEVVRRMHGRAETLSHRRTELFRLMRGLWAQLCLVRSADATTEGRAVERLRALCAEIAATLDASTQITASRSAVSSR